MHKLIFFFFLIALIFKSSIAEDSSCSGTLDPGQCKGYFERYGFDTSINKCRIFVYGGCGGNKNNYETIEECKAACEN